MPDQSQLMPLRAAAERIGISYRALLQAVHDETVPHYRLEKSRMLVSVDEVVSLMKKGGGNESHSN